MGETDSAAEVVRQFCEAWSTDVEAVLAFLADDAVYHNIPVEPVTGIDAIRATIQAFIAGVESIEFVVHHLVADGGVVLTERTDIFRTAGKTIELPVMGTFEVADGKITAWRDYFDLNQFLSQIAG